MLCQDGRVFTEWEGADVSPRKKPLLTGVNTMLGMLAPALLLAEPAHIAEPDAESY